LFLTDLRWVPHPFLGHFLKNNKIEDFSENHVSAKKPEVNITGMEFVLVFIKEGLKTKIFKKKDRKNIEN